MSIYRYHSPPSCESGSLLESIYQKNKKSRLLDSNLVSFLKSTLPDVAKGKHNTKYKKVKKKKNTI